LHRVIETLFLNVRLKIDQPSSLKLISPLKLSLLLSGLLILTVSQVSLSANIAHKKAVVSIKSNASVDSYFLNQGESDIVDDYDDDDDRIVEVPLPSHLANGLSDYEFLNAPIPRKGFRLNISHCIFISCFRI
jgi:hypothetical protein